MHSAPADLAFGRETLAVVLRDTPASRNISAISFVPPAGSRSHWSTLVEESMRMPRSSNTEVAHLLADNAGLLHLVEEALAVISRGHCRATAGATPDGATVGRISMPKLAIWSDALHLVQGDGGDLRVGEPQVDAS